MDLAAGYVNTGRNAAPHVQQGVQLDRTFVATKLSPGEKRQAQIDGRGIEPIHRLGQVHAEGFLAAKVARDADQYLGKVPVDAPVADSVGVSQGVARDLSPETHVIELGLLSAKTSFDVAQAAAISQLGEHQAKELIPTGEALDVPIALVAIDANLKLVSRDEFQKLRENTSAKIHLLPPAWIGKQHNDAKRTVEN